MRKPTPHINLKTADHKCKDTPFNACPNIKSNSAAEVWGWTLQVQVSTCNISRSFRNICVGFSIWNDSHLKWMRHGQTDHPRAQGSFCHHRENRSSENNAITQKLQIHTQPPEQNDIPEWGYISVQMSINQSKCIIGCQPQGAVIQYALLHYISGIFYSVVSFRCAPSGCCWMPESFPCEFLSRLWYLILSVHVIVIVKLNVEECLTLLLWNGGSKQFG